MDDAAFKSCISIRLKFRNSSAQRYDQALKSRNQPDSLYRVSRMITFPESVPPRISRENGRAGHPLSGCKVPVYEAKNIRELIEKPCRIIDRIRRDQINDRVFGSDQKGPEKFQAFEFSFFE